TQVRATETWLAALVGRRGGAGIARFNGRARCEQGNCLRRAAIVLEAAGIEAGGDVVKRRRSEIAIRAVTAGAPGVDQIIVAGIRTCITAQVAARWAVGHDGVDQFGRATEDVGYGSALEIGRNGRVAAERTVEQRDMAALVEDATAAHAKRCIV